LYLSFTQIFGKKKIAVEEAIRLKEEKFATETIAVSIGPKQCAETIRTALAMGCDRGIHIQTDLRTDYIALQPYAIAQLLQRIVDKEKPDLVLLGKQGIDSDCGQTGPYLAGLLNWPQVTFASQIKIPPKGGILVERETDTGTESMYISTLPALITCDLRLNDPRYPTLPSIMKAKRKPIETIYVEDFTDIDLQPRNKILEIIEPPPRKSGIMVSSVDELLDKLHNEAKVI
jgi:electron transfer flavoprotein beta subunit